MAAAGCAAFANSASAASLKVVHSFCNKSTQQQTCTDGASSRTAILVVSAHQMFGTASMGGKHGGGMVFEIDKSQSGSWTYTDIHDFCSQADCADGETPLGDLIADKDGNLYGTTWTGAHFNEGTVYKLRHTSNGWVETVIGQFCTDSQNGICQDGAQPAAGLTYTGQASGVPWDEFSPLFGTTYHGGSSDHGTVFMLTSDGSLWNQTVLYSLVSGNNPGALGVDTAGNLYGSTYGGGSHQAGLIFRLAHDTWQSKILYNFCPVSGCADGANAPTRPLVDSAGDVFGTTLNGGSLGGGVVYELTPARGGFAYHVIHDFAQPSDQGETPQGGVIMDSGGDLYGTAQSGASALDAGAIYRLHHTANGWKHTLLHRFCAQTNCADGKYPEALLALDSSGDLFGTTNIGGKNSQGTVFEFTP
jgi:uncharacterized repeat protein (TIGR03803 family)